MWRMTRHLFLAFLVCLSGLATAQDEDATEDPCGPSTDKKIVKLLEDAGKAKDPVERHQKLKSTLEIDGECASCLFQLGMSAYRIGKEGGKGYGPAMKYFEQLQAKCPTYHSDVPYHLGIMHYAQDEFAEAAKAFEAFR